MTTVGLILDKVCPTKPVLSCIPALRLAMPMPTASLTQSHRPSMARELFKDVGNETTASQPASFLYVVSLVGLAIPPVLLSVSGDDLADIL